MSVIYRAAQPDPMLDDIANILAVGAAEQAATLLRADAARSSGSRDAAMLWAQQRMAVGDMAGAASLVKTLWQHAADDAATYALASLMQAHHGQTAEAARSARMALAFDNRRPEYWARYEALHERPHWPTPFDVALYVGHPRLGPMPKPSEVLQQSMGGSESMALLMARGLAQSGLRVALCSNYERATVDDGVHCLPLEDFYLLQRYAAMPMAIVSRFPQPFLNECTAGQRIFWLHDIVAESYAPVYAQMDPQVDCYWALSAYQQDLYVARCRLRPEKFWRTTNVIDPAWCPVCPPRNDRVPGQLMYLSRPGRGLAEALEIYAHICDRDPTVSLRVCTYSTGNVWDDPELLPMRDRLQSLPGVTLQSLSKPDLLRELARTMVVLYPNASPAETSCLAAIEAQLMGVPVVTSDRGCLAETVIDGVTGVVIPWAADTACPVTAFVESVVGLLHDAVRWETLSIAGWEQARTRHAIDAVVGTWREQIIR